MACTACLLCLINTVNGHCNKKRKEKKKLTLGRLALVAGTQQTLSKTFYIYGCLMTGANAPILVHWSMRPTQEEENLQQASRSGTVHFGFHFTRYKTA
jgi:hypothetical protein